MKPFRGGRWLCALVALAAGSVEARAAWDNVFQVCCNSCGSKPVVSSYYAPQATGCCPQPTCCTTQYVQRCYYQPVTCYQSKTYYEPVTSYRTSYYYEPVTSYRYSCYYDPCTCSYQQVACPQTCYRLRSQTCATTSYLQRCCQVPVTSYRLSYYMEPVTTCSAPPACPSPCQPASPGVSETPAPSSPGVGVQENRQTAPPAAAPSGDGTNRYYQPQPTNPPPMGSSTLRQVPAPGQPAPPPPPTVKLDRIVALPAPSGNVQGQVVLKQDISSTPLKVVSGEWQPATPSK